MRSAVPSPRSALLPSSPKLVLSTSCCRPITASPRARAAFPPAIGVADGVLTPDPGLSVGAPLNQVRLRAC